MKNIDSGSCYHSKTKADDLFTTKQCDDLFTALLVDDDLYPEVTLPTNIHHNYSADQLQQCFAISLQLWQQGLDRKELVNFMTKIMHQQQLTNSEQLAFRYLRAKFKHVRFSFANCDRKHKYPLLFNGFIALMGQLQDTLKNNQPQKSRANAFLLKSLLFKIPYCFIVNCIHGFKPTNPNRFHQFISKENNFLQSNITEKYVTGKQFHEIRITISRRVSLYDNLKVLFPSSYHNDITEYLSTINGLMGDLHDKLVSMHFNKTQHYYKDRFQIPEEIHVRLNTFINNQDTII